MTTQSQTGKLELKDFSRGAAFWLWLSIAAALLAIVGSIIALAVKSIYAGLTPAFLPQAIAQDIVNLALVAPAWLVLAVLALRGSLRAYLLWLGVLTFTVYNYVIYTFAVPFGPLFLLWVAVLGLSLYALIGGLAAVDPARVSPYFKSRGAVVVTAWSLIVAAILFGEFRGPAADSVQIEREVEVLGRLSQAVEVLFENRSVVVKGSKLTDMIDAMGTRAYRIQVRPHLFRHVPIASLPMLAPPRRTARA